MRVRQMGEEGKRGTLQVKQKDELTSSSSNNERVIINSSKYYPQLKWERTDEVMGCHSHKQGFMLL